MVDTLPAANPSTWTESVERWSRETCGHRACERAQYQVSAAIPTFPLQVASGRVPSVYSLEYTLLGGWANNPSLLPRNLTGLSNASHEADQRSTRNWKPWSCALHRRIGHGAMIALSAPWPIWDTPSATNRWATS